MEGSIACPCLLFFLKNFTALCFSSSQQHRKSINQKLFSLETVYLWSISSLNKIHIACFWADKVHSEMGKIKAYKLHVIYYTFLNGYSMYI